VRLHRRPQLAGHRDHAGRGRTRGKKSKLPETEWVQSFNGARCMSKSERDGSIREGVRVILLDHR